MDTESSQRADAQQTRQKLIRVGLEQFGRLGFDAVGTRGLANAAGVNLAAIKYHFGGKEGLYLAVAEHIAQQMVASMAPIADAIQARFAPASARSPDDAIDSLRELASGMVTLIATNPETALWMRFILREQAEPSEAFEIIYNRIMRRMHMLVTALIAAATGEKADSDAARLKAFALIGQIIVFRVARAAVLKRMEWDDISADETEKIRRVIMANIDALRFSGKGG